MKTKKIPMRTCTVSHEKLPKKEVSDKTTNKIKDKYVILKAAKERCFISVSKTISFPCKWMSASAPPLSIPLKLAGIKGSPG